MPFVWIVSPEDQDRGISLIVSSVQRIPTQSVDPTVKNFHWGDLVRGQYEAFDRAARTAVLLDANGNVTEEPGFNVFALVNGTLMTPEAGVLEGITRRTVLELAQQHDQPVQACAVPATVLMTAHEVFLTSTAGGVMPVISVDGRQIGDGRPGMVTRRLRELYWAAHDDARYATPVDYD